MFTRYSHCWTEGYDLYSDMVRTSFLERNGSYPPTRNCNYPKKGATKLLKNIRGITATSLVKLAPDVKYRVHGYLFFSS